MQTIREQTTALARLWGRRIDQRAVPDQEWRVYVLRLTRARAARSRLSPRNIVRFAGIPRARGDGGKSHRRQARGGGWKLCEVTCR